MRLGLGSYAYAWAIGIPGYPPVKPMDVFAFVQRAARLGLRAVQIADNLPLHSLPKSQLKRLTRMTEELGIAVEVGTRGIAPSHLRRYLELATQFRSPILRIVIDTAVHHPTEDEIVETLRPLVPEFESANVILAIENHDRFKAATLSQIVQTLDSGWIGVCLDTVNSLGAAEGPEAVVHVLGPYVVNLHVKDFAIQRLDHMLGFSVEGRIAGKGQLDIAWLLDTLQAYARTESAILELWPPPEGIVEATIEKEDAWVVESVRFLRKLITG